MLLNCNRRPEQPNRYVLLGWKREISKAFARDSSGGNEVGYLLLDLATCACHCHVRPLTLLWSTQRDPSARRSSDCIFQQEKKSHLLRYSRDTNALHRIPAAASGARLGFGRHVFAVPWRHASFRRPFILSHIIITALRRHLGHLESSNHPWSKVTYSKYSSSERVSWVLKHRPLPTLTNNNIAGWKVGGRCDLVDNTKGGGPQMPRPHQETCLERLPSRCDPDFWGW